MKKTLLVIALAFASIMLNGCSGTNNEETATIANLIAKIPANAVKMTPLADTLPPILHSNEWDKPIPVPSKVNTAGGEDSAMVMPDGNTLYFWSTPDVNIPAEKQVIDGVTGIYVSKKSNGEWQEPERIFLEKKGKAVLDGCGFVQGDTMWFCSTREGYTGMHWFTAQYKDDKWQNWKNAEYNSKWEVGEFHITSDGNELYFHSPRGNADGNYDVWVSKKSDSEWQEPTKLDIVNTGDTEGWPFVTEDGNELWITRIYKGSPAIFRSKKLNGEWQKPELIISQFAGEASLDKDGNIYFTHHYYKDNQMIEADIYVAYKK